MKEHADLSRPDGDWNHELLEVGDITVHFVREGEGPPLLLLHGWPEFWWSWHRTIPHLSTQFDVIAPDLRGFGDTLDPPGAQAAGADVHAHDIVALADALGFDTFGLVSHDVGAYVAQEVARTSPDRLSGLFFFNCPYPGIGRRWVDPTHVPEIWYQSFNQLPWAAQLVGQDRTTCQTFLQGIFEHWSHNLGSFDDYLGPFVDNFLKPGRLESGFAWYAATHAARMRLVADGAPKLPVITTPSRFFWGRHDPVIKCSWMDDLPNYFAEPHIEIAEEAGHFVHLESPEQANSRIVEFFTHLD